MSDFEDVKPYTQAELDQQAIWANEFDQWWESEGQYQRAGGGQYERTFAWWAWLNREQKQQAIIDDLKAQLECCRKENAVLLGKVGEGEKRVSELNQWNSNQYELIKRNESHTQSLKHLLQKLIDDDYTTMRPSMAYEIQEILRGAND